MDKTINKERALAIDGMDATELPFFDRFERVSADNELFEAVLSGETLEELPQDDVFIVSHSLVRDTPMGVRDHHELVYVLSGRATAIIGDRKTFLLKDSLLLATTACSFGLMASHEPTVVVVVGLRPHLFEEGVFAELAHEDTPVGRALSGTGGHDHLVLSDTHGRIIFRSMRALLKEYRHACQTASISVRARVLLLLAQLAEIETYSFYGMDQKMTEVLAYLREHCAETSVASLARHFGYSETYFSHLVHEQTGMRARDLIVAERLRRARELLATTDLSVEEVSEAVGYASYSHFNRIFRAAYHITPATWRNYVSREL